MEKTMTDTPRAGAELLACPACGKLPYLHETDWTDPPTWTCYCFCLTQSHLTEADAVAAWNRCAALQRPPQPAAEGGVELGKCDVTLTERYANPGCVCATYAGNKGPCRSWEAGANGRCVYCDHTMACHLEMCQAALQAASAEVEATCRQIAAVIELHPGAKVTLDSASALLRRLDAERGELKRIAKYADIPVVASEPLETCCFCNQPIGIGQAYDRLDAGRYCHLGCWFAERQRSVEPAPRACMPGGSPE
jgi:hypothetical protein